MSEKPEERRHLLLAQSRHEQATSFHREASRHFETGKDYAHGAHQAWIAHGYGLQARTAQVRWSRTTANMLLRDSCRIRRCHTASRLRLAALV